MVVSDSSIPDRSTGTEACAFASTARASRGGKVSSGGPPEAFSICKNAFTPLGRRGSTATSTVCSRSTCVGLLMTPPFLWWWAAPGRPSWACAGLLTGGLPEVGLDEPEILIDAPRDLGADIGRIRVTACVGLLNGLTDARAVGGQRGRERLNMVALLHQRERVGFQTRARRRHLDRPLRGATQLDDAFREQIHGVLGGIDHLVEQLVQRDKARPLDIPVRLLGLVHEVNAVGAPRVEDLDHLSTRLGLQIILCLVHLGFLPFFNPPSLCMGLYGTSTTWPVSSAWHTSGEPSRCGPRLA